VSEPKLVSPLLDDFAVGEAISQHYGVRSYPAMQKDSDSKYIVKIISIPASQRSLDALLLAGAFPDAQAARNYFRELAEGVVQEAEILQKLAKLEGFVSYRGWQIEPKEEETGFDVYLLSDYRRSLERHFRREPMTHLAAVNLGLDLCAALAVCRRCGYLYINLKPGNIFIGEDHEYRIGELGFVPLDSLQHTYLPDRYRSAYTAPEIVDAFCSLNNTLDTYAAGLILYQAYNNGVLPFEGSAPNEPLPPPMYADYEMAAIIGKACDPDPKNRWEDPLEMGKALVSYMQRNSINDVPIVPPSVAEQAPAEAADEELPDDDYLAQDLAAVNASLTDGETEAAEGSQSNTDDETLPSEESAAGLEEAPLTDEVSAMLALADELIAHDLPEPVVAPEPVDIPMPEPLLPEEPDADVSVEEPDFEPAALEPQLQEPESEEEEAPAPVRTKPPRSYKGLIIFLLIVAIGLSLFTGGYAFYNFYYLQTIEDISLVSSDEQVTVKLTTTVENKLLTVLCKDTYGNTQRKQVENGQAVFDELNPGTSYIFTVEISGLHTLVGETEATLTTARQTSILNLSIIGGAEDGAAILSFTVQGPDSSWQVVCTAEGESPKTFSCVNHTANLNGLTPGVTYDIRLVPAASLYVVGDDSTTYTATAVICAQDLTVSSFRDNKLTITWSSPEKVESWTVRCYDNDKVDLTLTVTDTQAVFEDLDPSKAYNIEVTAQGMTRGVTTYVSANTVNVYDLKVETADKNSLHVTWNFSGNAPEGGWRVLYYVDGGSEPLLVNCESTSATLPLIPDSHYEISILQASGATVLDGTVTYDTPAAQSFEGYWLTSESLDFRTCMPTEDQIVTQDTVTFTDSFAPGTKASILMHTGAIYQNGYEEIVNLYVIRDSKGAVVSVTNPTRIWADMLEGGFGLINLPAVPSAAGAYTIDIFFNGAYVSSVTFHVA